MSKQLKCECDDGFEISVNITSARTSRQLVLDVCRLRNSQNRAEDLSVVSINDSGEIQCLLCPDVSVIDSIGESQTVRIIGWKEATALNPFGAGVRLLHGSASRADAGENTKNRESRKRVFVADIEELQRLKEARTSITASPGTKKSDWDDKFDMLLEYSRVKGTCNVSQYVDFRLPDGSDVKLGSWLHHQREYKRKGTLPKEREEKLQELVDKGLLAWDLVPATCDDVSWDVRFALLEKYGEEHGTCNVANSHITKLEDGTDVKLGGWVSWQRTLKKRGQLRADRVAKLQEMVDAGKFAWHMGHANMSGTHTVYADDENWNQRFNALVKYGEEHNGNCNMPKSYFCTLANGQEVGLGRWLDHQRQRKKKNTMRTDRAERLQSLVDEGKLAWSLVTSSATDDDSWDQRFDKLIQYGEENGNCNVPKSYRCHLNDDTEVKLGGWVSWQRTLKKRGQLRADRVDRIQELVDSGRFSWNLGHIHLSENGTVISDEEIWNQRFEAVVKYGEEHDGNCNMPKSHMYMMPNGEEVKLGCWLDRQRQRKRKDGLRPDRDAKLQALVDAGKLGWTIDGVGVGVSDDIGWKERYDLMLLYAVSHNGDCNVPKSYVTTLPDGSEFNLGAWVSYQRTSRNKRRLQADRERRLQVLVDKGKLKWNTKEDKEVTSESNDTTNDYVRRAKV